MSLDIFLLLKMPPVLIVEDGENIDVSCAVGRSVMGFQDGEEEQKGWMLL